MQTYAVLIRYGSVWHAVCFRVRRQHRERGSAWSQLLVDLSTLISASPL